MRLLVAALLCWFMIRRRRRQYMMNCLLVLIFWKLLNNRGYDSSGRALPYPRLLNRSFFESVVPSFSDDEFRRHFRLQRIHFRELCRSLPQSLSLATRKRRPPLPVALSLSILIYRLASNACVRDLSTRFGVSESTVVRSCKRLIPLLIIILKPLLSFPSTIDDFRRSSAEFRHLRGGVKGFEGVVGAVDGCHIPLDVAPINDQRSYFNRKQFHSVLLQGYTLNHMKDLYFLFVLLISLCVSVWYGVFVFVCVYVFRVCAHRCVNARGIFIDINVGWPGSVHDARVFRNSSLFSLGSSLPPPFFLIADSAYPLYRWILTPFRVPISRRMFRFNKHLSTMRIAVEHAFGRLKGRWRMLRRSLNVGFDDVNQYIFLAVLLHNFCEYRDDSWDNEYAVDMGLDDSVAHSPDELGVVARERIASELFARY